MKEKKKALQSIMEDMKGMEKQKLLGAKVEAKTPKDLKKGLKKAQSLVDKMPKEMPKEQPKKKNIKALISDAIKEQDLSKEEVLEIIDELFE